MTETSSSKLIGIPFASSSETAYSPLTLADNDTTNSTDTVYAWRSLASYGPHFSGLALTTVYPVTRMVLVIPNEVCGTAISGIHKFKPQYQDGGAWMDAQVISVTHATSDSSGWWNADTAARSFSFNIIAVLSDSVRFLQDSAGGRSIAPFIMLANEIEAYSATNITYTHDNLGNLINKTNGSISENYSYDYKNGFSGYTRAENSTTISDYSYLLTPGRQRLAKENLLTGHKEYYLYDGDDVLADYIDTNGTAQLARQYVQTPGIDSKIAWFDSSAIGTEVSYFLTDALGSNTGSYSDSLKRQEVTDAWGNSLLEQGTPQTRYGFTGREKDEESGLMHYRHRAYDTKLGRFLGRDPVNPVGDHYVYAGNNPVMLVDPMGLQGENPWWKKAFKRFIDNPVDPIGVQKGWKKAIAFIADVGNEAFLKGNNPVYEGVSTYYEFGKMEVTSKVNSIKSGDPLGGSHISGVLYDAFINGNNGANSSFIVEKERLQYLYDINRATGASPFEAGGETFLIGIADFTGVTALYESGSGHSTDFRIIVQTGQPRQLDLASRLELGISGGTRLASIAAGGVGGVRLLVGSNPSKLAALSQGNPRYPGIDRWKNIELKDGQLLVGSPPGSSAGFFTTLKSLKRTGFDKRNYWQRLQVAPHPVKPYRPEVGIYRVKNGLRGAFGQTKANPQYGPYKQELFNISKPPIDGPLPQVYIPNYSRLELVTTIRLK